MFNEIYLPSCCITVRSEKATQDIAPARPSRVIDKGMYERLLAMFENEDLEDSVPAARGADKK